MNDIEKWYEKLTYEDAKDLLQEKLTNMKMNFIAAGYFMKYIRDHELYLEDGYANIWEFAEDIYGIKRTTASRWMQMNDRFSVDGNTPILADEYKAFGKSQLQEMLYLEDEQMEEVNPDMTVKEIRELRSPEKKLVKPDQDQREYLDAFARHFIACKHDWLLQDFQNRVMNVDKSPVEIKNHLGANNRTWHFSTDDGVAHINLFDDYVQVWGEEGMCIGDFDWFYLAAAIQRMWNIVAMENAQKEQKTKCATSHKSGTCIHRPEFSCTLPEASKLAVGDGIDWNRKCCWDCPKRMECGYRCNSAAGHPIEEQIPGQMHVEDYPEILPEPEDTDSDIDNDEDNVVIEQPENVINQTESVIEDDENVIDAEYTEVAAENTEVEEMRCQEAVNLDELTFSQIAIWDYLEEEERTLAEYEKVNSEDGGLPLNLMMRQRMLVKGLRLLMEHEADQDDQEEDDEPEEFEPVQPELPVLRNNDQRKEWLKDYKSWGLWYRDENIDVNYYKYDFSDGSRLVVAEYPQRRVYWKPNEFADEHYYHLLEKNCKCCTSEKRFDRTYMHSTDSETYLVEFLKNLQKGDKK